MSEKPLRAKVLHYMLFLLVFAIALPLFSSPDEVAARRGGDDSRQRFYGIIESMPDKDLRGQWVIGGRTVTADSATEFDQEEGPLAVGACAKVDIRNGRVHEIDSEPLRDCR